jgi:histidinol-phosphate aminotransferase
MSRFLVPALRKLVPYTPGEQPQSGSFVKLNTNESPYLPSSKVIEAVCQAAPTIRLYPDPDCRVLTKAIAAAYLLPPEQVVCGNGSDELLAFIFQSLCPNGAAFADVTYGFYKVWAQLYGLETEVIPLGEDFSFPLAGFRRTDKTVFIANPNAPTGMALPASEIASFAAEKPDRLVIVDEAYVDFGAESCLKYINGLDNLLVVQTFSKSRNLAGGRIAFAAGSKELINDLNTVRFSFHPYSISRLSQAAGTAAVYDRAYFEECTAKIQNTRARVEKEIDAMGFFRTRSLANFMFIKHPSLSGRQLYLSLREKGILVRWFDLPRISDYLRVTVGSDGEMDAFLAALNDKEAAK